VKPGSAKTHENLEVWRRAIVVAKHVYRLSAQLPSYELFGLSNQLRRAAVSIPANIAEGAARGYTKDFLRFLGVAQGALAELETHLVLVREPYEMVISVEPENELVSLRRMLIRLRSSISRTIPSD
jgi:four helix bundle protein